MIVITGTTGAVGGQAAAQLAAAQVPLRQLVRDPARAPQLPNTSITTMAALDDDTAVAAAIDPGDTVFLVSAFADHDERMRLHRGFIDAAVQAGAAHLVYLSFVGAAPDAVFLHARSHGETEDYLRASGIGFTILRTSYYYWTIANFVTDGVLAAGDGRVGWVAPEDCGRAVAAVVQREPENRTYTLTGPSSPTFAELASQLQALPELAGLGVRYVREPDADRIPLVGIPDWARAHRRSSHLSFAAGEADAVTDDVRLLTGRDPVTLADYVAGNPAPFRAAASPRTRPISGAPLANHQ